MRAILASIAFLAMPLAGAQEFVEGQDYLAINPAQPTRDDSKVEVVEVFGYACPHCKSFQAFIHPWSEEIPEHVDFRRMPVIFGPSWEPLARAYYVADILDKVDEVHAPIFKALHEERRNLINPTEMKDFFAKYDVTPEQFESTSRSFAVENQIARSNRMARAYQVRGTPSVVVNGKYIVSSRETNGSYEKLLEVVDFLIEKEHAAMDVADNAESDATVKADSAQES